MRRYASVRERQANIHSRKEVRSLPTVFQSRPAEYVIERSRFIGQSFRLTDAGQLAPRLAELRAQYPGANHYTWAYRLNEAQMRASDDGEPHGTAGLPMLNILTREDWEETLVVAIRYFGGIKLGRGGLVRAYQRTAQLALERTQPGRMTAVTAIRLEIEYSHYERLSRILEPKVLALEPEFGAKVILDFSTASEAWPEIESLFNQEAFHEWRLLDQQEAFEVLPVSVPPAE